MKKGFLNTQILLILFLILSINVGWPQELKTFSDFRKSNKHKVSQRVLQNNEYTTCLIHDLTGKNELGFHSAPLYVFKNDTLIFTHDAIIGHCCWHQKNNVLIYFEKEEIREYGYGAPARRIWAFKAEIRSKELVYSIPENKKLYFVRSNYASFDNNFYIRNMASDTTRVFILDIEGKNIVPTEYKGIRFSPDGNYYSTGSYEGEGIMLFDSNTNTPFWDVNYAYDQRLLDVYWKIIDSVCFSFVLSFDDLFKYNCNTRKLIKKYKRPDYSMKPIIREDTVIWQ